MIKLLNILKETQILVPRRSPEERQKNYQIAIQKKIQQYIKGGSRGDLNLNGTPIQSLPDNLEVGGDLYLRNTPIQSLPNDLKVGGYLDLRNTQIQSLPDNLKVIRGALLLDDSQIQSLPDDLKVRGDLYLNNCKNFKSLPNGLEVGGYLDLSNTPLAKKYTTKEQLKAKYPDLKVKKEIYL